MSTKRSSARAGDDAHLVRPVTAPPPSPSSGRRRESPRSVELSWCRPGLLRTSGKPAMLRTRVTLAEAVMTDPHPGTGRAGPEVEALVRASRWYEHQEALGVRRLGDAPLDRTGPPTP